MLSIIHYCSKEHPFNGNIFYHFEYFIFLIERSIEVELRIIGDGASLNVIISVMEDRYNLKNIEYKDKIIFSMSTMHIHKFDKIISNAKTIHMLKDKIFAEEAHIMHTWDSHELKIKDSDLSTNFKKSFFYNELTILGEVNYTRCLYLDLLKVPEKSDDAIYLHVCGVRNISTKEFIQHVLPIKKDRKMIVSFPKSQQKELDFYRGLNNVEGFENHVPNLFSKFDTYFYILLQGIDYSPRMLIESSYLKKNIIFVNRSHLVHGGNKRYDDILKRNTDKYNLTETDTLIRNFLR
jgi:hypothetical protein